MSNLGGDIAQCPVSLPGIKLWLQQSKNTRKQISNFSCLIKFYWISLFCSKYFVQDYLSKQSFGFNSSQSPSNLNFFDIFILCIIKRISIILKQNIKQVKGVTLPNLMVLCKQYFSYLVQIKIGFRKLWSLLIGSFLTELTFLNQMGIFFQNFESSLEVQRAKRKFSENLGHNILELCNVLVQIRLTTSKRKSHIQYSKLVMRVASRDVEQLKTQDLRK